MTVIIYSIILISISLLQFIFSFVGSNFQKDLPFVHKVKISCLLFNEAPFAVVINQAI